MVKKCRKLWASGSNNLSKICTLCLHLFAQWHLKGWFTKRRHQKSLLDSFCLATQSQKIIFNFFYYLTVTLFYSWVQSNVGNLLKCPQMSMYHFTSWLSLNYRRCQRDGPIWEVQTQQHAWGEQWSSLQFSKHTARKGVLWNLTLEFTF